MLRHRWQLQAASRRLSRGRRGPHRNAGSKVWVKAEHAHHAQGCRCSGSRHACARSCATPYSATTGGPRAMTGDRRHYTAEWSGRRDIRQVSEQLRNQSCTSHGPDGEAACSLRGECVKYSQPSPPPKNVRMNAQSWNGKRREGPGPKNSLLVARSSIFVLAVAVLEMLHQSTTRKWMT